MDNKHFHGKRGTQRNFVKLHRPRYNQSESSNAMTVTVRPPHTEVIELDRPEEAKGVKATYTTDPVEGEAWLRNNVVDMNQSVLGFDMEWKPQFIKKKLGGKENRTAVLQLSTETSCLVLHIIHIKTLPRYLVDILNNKDILKVGCGIRPDITKLLKDTGLVCKGAIDLVQVGKKAGYGEEHGQGLKALSQNLLGIQMDKPKSVQLSNWEEFPLKRNQIHYATLDAWIGIKLYLHMKRGDEVDNETLPAPQVPIVKQQCVCGVCGKKCKGDVDLQDHLSNAGHTTCTTCGKTFVDQIPKRHIRKCVMLTRLAELGSNVMQ